MIGWTEEETKRVWFVDESGERTGLGYVQYNNGLYHLILKVTPQGHYITCGGRCSTIKGLESEAWREFHTRLSIGEPG